MSSSFTQRFWTTPLSEINTSHHSSLWFSPFLCWEHSWWDAWSGWWLSLFLLVCVFILDASMLILHAQHTCACVRFCACTFTEIKPRHIHHFRIIRTPGIRFCHSLINEWDLTWPHAAEHTYRFGACLSGLVFKQQHQQQFEKCCSMQCCSKMVLQYTLKLPKHF